MINNYRALTFDELCGRLTENKNTLIVYHVRSDADAVGSAFALRAMMRDMNIPAFCACADEIPDRLRFLTDEAQGSARMEGLELDFERVISVDSASPKQLGDMYGELKGRIDIMIDHHSLGTPYADNYIEPDAAATGEIIYSIAKKLFEEGKLTRISPYVMKCLYAAISSDTGCFKYSNVTPRTHIYAAELIEAGVNSADINHKLFDTKSIKQIMAEREAASSMRVLFDGTLAIVKIPYSVKAELGLSDEHLDTVIEIPRVLEGVSVAAAIKQLDDDGSFRISLRSNDEFDVSRICALLGGGGHKKAAGCTIEAADIDEAEEKFLEAFSKLI